jgi:hypothetical protein
MSISVEFGFTPKHLVRLDRPGWDIHSRANPIKLITAVIYVFS